MTTTTYPTTYHTRGTTYSRAGLYTLPAGTWSATAAVYRQDGSLVQALDVNLETFAEPDVDGYTHALSVLATASDTEAWPLAVLLQDILFQDADPDPVIIPAVTHQVVVAAHTSPATDSDNPLQTITGDMAPVLRGETVLGEGGGTDLSYTASATNGIVVSSTGNDATLPLGTGTNAGLLAPAQFTKLSNLSGTNTGDQNLSGYALTSHNHTGVYDPAGTAAGAVAAHAGTGGAAHADAIAGGAAGFMTGADKTKLDGIASGATAVTVDANPTDGSANAVSSNGTFDALTGKAATGAIGSSGLTMATAKLLGRSTAATGAVEEITLGTNLSYSGTTLNAAGGGGSPGGSTTQVQYNNAGAFAGASGITTTGTELAIAGGTTTTSKPLIDLSQTWNNAGVAFSVIRMNITKTASIGYSPLIDLQVNSSSVFYLREDGALQYTLKNLQSFESQTGLKSNGWVVASTYLYLGTGTDISLSRNASGIAELTAGSTGTNFRDLKLRNVIGTGNIATGIVAKTADYTATADDGTIEVDASGAARTITLFACSGNAGKIIVIKKVDSSANAVTVDANASETIDGATTVSLASQWSTITIQVNAAGTGWYKLSGV